VNEKLKASSADVRFAYRLLLGREPDPEGFQHHSETVRVGSVGTVELARTIMMSAEYAAGQSRGGRLREVEVDGIKLFPWKGDSLIGDHVSAESDYEPNVLPLFLE
jgi:hypothetical protein